MSGNARRSASKEALGRRAVTRAQRRTVHHEPIEVEQILFDLRATLVACGIEAAGDISPLEASNALLLCEACNLAAKVVSASFYDMKPAAIEAALAMGCEGGWGEDGAFYLYAPGVGTASFHDPWFQIGVSGWWEHPWSGMCRQHLAFLALESASIRRLLEWATAPGADVRPGTAYRAVARVAGAMPFAPM